MAKKDDYLLGEVVIMAKSLWRHRPGQETVGAILDTFDNLGYITKDERKPLLIHKRKTAYGWHLIFSLPPGISFGSVVAKRDYFENAANAFIRMEWRDGKAHFDIQAGSLPESVKYEWDHQQYSKMWLPLPVGVSQKGVEVLDLAESPHLLVAGATGFG